jgi:hypothetical protein
MMNLKMIILLSLSMLLASQSYAKGVLIIGDSLSVPDGYGLGRELEKQLTKQGHQVAIVASCGSAPSSFIDRNYSTRCGYYQKTLSGKTESISYQDFRDNRSPPKLTPKLDKIYDSNTKPDLTVIQQGTNLYGLILKNSPADGKRLVTAEVTKLLKNVKSGQCLWVGPPTITKLNGVTVQTKHTDLMAQAIQEGIKSSGKGCEYLDSRTVTKAPGGDGTHFSRPSQTKDWIAAAFQSADKLLRNSVKPSVNPSSVVPADVPKNAGCEPSQFKILNESDDNSFTEVLNKMKK